MTTREKKNWYFGRLREWAARCGSLTDRWLRLRTWEHLSHEKAEDAHLQGQLNTQMKKRRWYLKRKKLLPLRLPFHFSGGLARLPSWSLGSVRPLQPPFLHPLFIWSHICHFSLFVIRVSGPKPAVTLRHLDMEPSGEQGSFRPKSWPDDSLHPAEKGCSRLFTIRVTIHTGEMRTWLRLSILWERALTIH